ncbi:MAG: DsrE family protein [Gammaproteobacteria bacterium]|nr:DsrE family protein [Gammaproteobacteria bacterium]
MKILVILNDAPYGTERSYNALRLAKSLSKHDPDMALTLFLMADAVTCARHGQKPPSGYYNIELMLKAAARGTGNRVLLCGTCMDARGLTDDDVIEGATRSDMATLAAATVDADKVLVF